MNGFTTFVLFFLFIKGCLMLMTSDQSGNKEAQKIATFFFFFFGRQMELMKIFKIAFFLSY